MKLFSVDALSGSTGAIAIGAAIVIVLDILTPLASFSAYIMVLSLLIMFVSLAFIFKLKKESETLRGLVFFTAALFLSSTGLFVYQQTSPVINEQVVSSDPKKELASLGVSWTDEAYYEAIRNDDLTIIDLFVQAKKKPDKVIGQVLEKEPVIAKDIIAIYVRRGMDINKVIDSSFYLDKGLTTLEVYINKSLRSPSRFRPEIVRVLKKMGADTKKSIELVDERLDDIDRRIQNPHPCYKYVEKGRQVPKDIVNESRYTSNVGFFRANYDILQWKTGKTAEQRLQATWERYCAREVFSYNHGKQVTWEILRKDLESSKEPYKVILDELKS